ncbi:hypothetical protein Cgig2_012924 [Carnegiea gigantea]|uniref:Uncharacterized protein n=1 Tax=Carnegiea gigantea TaxID=171969 RepID=A0A9Q1JTA0_9CARY|nr:hypothetical protein Cgig2_012924 [Carnegiea gigantea]
MATFSLFPFGSSISPVPPHNHHFLSLPSPSIAPLSSSSDDAEFVADRRSVRVGLIVPSAPSNPKLLKTNRRSPYGEPLSVYDSDEEEVAQDSSCVNGVVDGDDNDDGFLDNSKLLGTIEARSHGYNLIICMTGGGSRGAQISFIVVGEVLNYSVIVPGPGHDILLLAVDIETLNVAASDVIHEGVKNLPLPLLVSCDVQLELYPRPSLVEPQSCC